MPLPFAFLAVSSILLLSVSLVVSIHLSHMLVQQLLSVFRALQFGFQIVLLLSKLLRI